MSAINEPTTRLLHLIDRLRTGDESARDELLNHLTDQLLPITRRMLRSFPRLHRWEQAEDVLQNAMLRLLKALETMTPSSLADLVGLARLEIKRELIDLSRHYFGPEGMGAKHATNAGKWAPEGSPHAVSELADPTRDPSKGAAWAEFHRQVAALPGDELEVFELLWFQQKTQAEAALLLGVSERTIKRRWQSARVSLARALDGKMPE